VISALWPVASSGFYLSLESRLTSDLLTPVF